MKKGSFPALTLTLRISRAGPAGRIEIAADPPLAAADAALTLLMAASAAFKTTPLKLYAETLRDLFRDASELAGNAPRSRPQTGNPRP